MVLNSTSSRACNVTYVVDSRFLNVVIIAPELIQGGSSCTQSKKSIRQFREREPFLADPPYSADSQDAIFGLVEKKIAPMQSVNSATLTSSAQMERTVESTR